MMPTLRFVTPTVITACCAALHLGCGGAKPPSTRTAADTGSASTSPAASAGPLAASPASTNVAISDEVRSKCGISDEDAYFPFDSARLTPQDRTPLDLVARCFTSGPLRGQAVKLVGRADPRGQSEYNLTLGQSRADAVGQYLDERGMRKSKTQSTSRGAMDSTGTDESTWQHDRRVDVLLGD